MLSSRAESILRLLLFATFAVASPLISPRAGAPIAKPIPLNCTVTDPVLCTSEAFCPPVSYEPFRPTNASLTSAPAGPLIYAYYLQPDSFQVTNSTANQLFQKCLETCYGYGDIGDCKSVYQAYNYPTPPMYGGPGGDPSTACVMFNRPVTVADFEVVPEDERDKWTGSRAGGISCPPVSTPS